MLKNPRHGTGPAEQPGVTFPTLDPSVGMHTFQPLMTGVAEFNGKAYVAWMELNRQWTEFLSGRFQEDVALVHHLAQCRNSQDILGVYTEFSQEAFADYQNEFAEIMCLG